MTQEMVENPEQVTIFGPNPQIVPANAVWACVIITPDSLATTFQPLVSWNTRRGLRTAIVDLDSIYQYWPGLDNPQKIRNFIKDQASFGTEYILIGGNPANVPARRSAIGCHWYLYGKSVPTMKSDHYYAALDGTWDMDGNGYYSDWCGAVDSINGWPLPEAFFIDYYADLSVGRSSVSDKKEAEVFVNKVLTYQQNPPPDYTNDQFLLMGAYLFGRCDIEAGFLKDSVVVDLPGEPSCFRLYDDTYDLCDGPFEHLRIDHAQAMNELKDGYFLINHGGHGYWGSISIDPEHNAHQSLDVMDLDTLSNGLKYGLFVSFSCLSAAMDTAIWCKCDNTAPSGMYFYIDPSLTVCFGKHWLTNPHGGGVAYVGNSGIGAGMRGHLDFSCLLDKLFFSSLFQDPSKTVGWALEKAKNSYPLHDLEEGVFYMIDIYCLQSLSLLGDPSMPVWITQPQSMIVSHPHSYQLGPNRFTVETGIPGALVCLWKESERYYDRKYADINGRTIFYPSFSSPGALEVTVTAPNYIPYQAKVISGELVESQTWPKNVFVCGDVTVPSGITLTIQPGAQIEFTAGEDNLDSGADPNLCELIVEGSLNAVGDPYRIYFSSDAGPGSWYGIRVKSGGFATIENATIKDGYCGISFDSAQEGHITSCTIKDDLVYGIRGCATDDLYIAGNTFSANDVYDIYTENCSPYIIGNDFSCYSNRDCAIKVVGDSPERQVTISGNTIAMPVLECDIPSEGDTTATTGIYMENASAQIVGNQITGGYYGIVGVSLDSTTVIKGTDYQDQILDRNLVGIALYAGSKPTVSNNDISDYRDIGVACYESYPLLGDSLIPGTGYNSITLGLCSPQYAVYCEGVSETIKAENNWWGSSPPDPSWFYGPVDYEPWLSQPPVGIETTIQPFLPDHFSLGQNYPNPFNSTTVIRYSLPVDRQKRWAVSLRIYNILGQVVRTLVDEPQTPGYYSVRWDGRDNAGRELASGIYIYRIRAGDFVQTRRMILLK